MKKEKQIDYLTGFYLKDVVNYKGKYKDLDIENYGEYRLGLTKEEIKHYLKAKCELPQYRRKFKYSQKLYNKFVEIMGVNTVAIAPNGESLWYRHDIERFAGVLFNREKTYFD